jgi:UDP-N-acetylglucosamine--N-acetylmuramyl-(pentapeptide) pyrophosphoryl-undecaprenol N-acetylglucosamine transferase
MSPAERTLLFAGGGTGGHVYPGLALAGEIESRGLGFRIRWVGSRGRVEERAVPRAGYPIDYLVVPHLKGRSAPALAGAVARLPLSGATALALVRRVAPVAVVGLGGFVSGPVGAAAAALGIPLFLLEQNAQPGLTNRLLGRAARRVYVSFAAAERHFPAGRSRLLGNPVRREIAAVRHVEADGDAVRVLVFGGSQGARSINENVPAILGTVARSGVAMHVTHVTGGETDAVAQRYAVEGLEATVVGYIDDMAHAYAHTDFVVCRAGATTIAELTAVGLPALYVPFPYAADDHQAANARAVVEAGGGVLVSDAEMSTDRPRRLLMELLRHPQVLQRMGDSARALGRLDPAARIADDMLAELGEGA